MTIEHDSVPEDLCQSCKNKIKKWVIRVVEAKL